MFSELVLKELNASSMLWEKSCLVGLSLNIGIDVSPGMSQSISMDEKGRIVLPKDLRTAARVQAPALFVATVKGEGRIELVAVDAEMSRAKEIARRKLAGWREEDHEAEKLAMRIVTSESKR